MLLLWYYLHAITVHWTIIVIVMVIVIVVVIICKESMYISSCLALSCFVFFLSWVILTCFELSWFNLAWYELTWVYLYYYCYYRHDTRCMGSSYIIISDLISSFLLIYSSFHSILFQIVAIPFYSIEFNLQYCSLLYLISIIDLCLLICLSLLFFFSHDRHTRTHTHTHTHAHTRIHTYTYEHMFLLMARTYFF